MSNARSVSITIRMDENLKKQFEKILDDIELSVSSAFTVFAKAVTKERKIPFTLEANSEEIDMSELNRCSDNLDHGRNVVYKTLDELKGMEK